MNQWVTYSTCNIVHEYYVIGNLLLHKSKEGACDFLLKDKLLSAMMNGSDKWMY